MAKLRVASKTEVLRILTGIARSEEETAQTRLKASELLGKAYGMFTDRGESESPAPFEVNVRVLGAAEGEGAAEGALKKTGEGAADET